MIRSLRARLLIGTTAITAAALLLLGWAIDHSIRRMLLAEFDNALLAKAKSLSSMVEYHDGKVEFEFDPAWMPEFTTPNNPDYFEIWIDGRSFARSKSLGASELGSAPPKDLPADWSRLPDGRRGRTVGLAFPPFVDPDERLVHGAPLPVIHASLVVARDTRALDATLSHLRWIALLMCAGVVVISGAALLLLVSFATRPVRTLAHRIETRPVLPEKLPPVREQAVALAPFQIGEANRLHPWLLAQPLLQAERLHPLSSWRMRTLRLAESSPWWPSTSAGWPEEGISSMPSRTTRGERQAPSRASADRS